jgi:flagellar assembly protein FliH
MASFSRIIGAADVTDVRRFKLEEFRQGAGGVPGKSRAATAPSAPPGYKEGLERGLEEGFQRGAAAAQEQFNHEHGLQMQAIADEFERRAERLHGAMAAALADVRTEVAEQTIELALSVARQVIRAQLRTAPADIEPVVREAIGCLVDDRSSFALHLSPDDADLLGPILEPMLQSRSARIVPDPAIQTGGCRIGSQEAEIDATLGTRWQRVVAAIGRPDAPLDEAIPA